MEITKSMAGADYVWTMAVLEELQARGVSLAFGDSGRGFSSLARLKMLPISIIKIDKQLVQEDSEVGRRHHPRDAPGGDRGRRGDPVPVPVPVADVDEAWR